MGLEKMSMSGMGWSALSRDRDSWLSVFKTVMDLQLQ